MKEEKPIEFCTISKGVLNKPVFIVGMWPGRQRYSLQSRRVWEGNRSADFIQEILEGQTNLYLTNITNFRVAQMTDNLIKKGLKKLLTDIKELKPRRIICLSNFTYSTLRREKVKTKLIRLPHPSFILRFNRSRELYRGMLLAAVEDEEYDPHTTKDETI